MRKEYKIFESLLYSNVFVCYERLFTSVQKQQLFKHFKTTNDSFSVVSHCILDETCILLESPFHVELNGLCPNPVY